MSFAALFARGGELTTGDIDDFRRNITRSIGGTACIFPGRTVSIAATIGDAIGANFHNLDAPSATTRIAGRARIHNAEALRRSLASDASPQSVANLLLALYQRWGLDMASHLDGEFAFVIYDEAKQSLSAFRDRFGVVPLFYSQTATSLAISDHEAALGVEAYSPITTEFVADYLMGRPGASDRTAHAGVKRLFPGHVLTFAGSAAVVETYWSIKPTEPQGEPVETFRKTFMAAVASRLPAKEQAAAMLSGGLDSSSIVAVLRHQGGNAVPVQAYSMVYQSPQRAAFDESRFIKVLVGQGGVELNAIHVDDFQPLSSLEDMFKQQLGLFIAPGLIKTRRIYARLRERGVRTVFDGHGGDEIVWYGTGRLRELASRGHWLKAMALVPVHSRLFGESPSIMAALLVVNFAPSNLPGRLFRRCARWLLRRDMKRRRPVDLARYVSAALRKADRDGATSSAPVTDYESHQRAMTSPMIGYSFEVLNKMARAYDLEVVYPFFDQALAALCLGLPASEKLRLDGTRSILRRAMRGLVPDAILRRQDKTNFVEEFREALFEHHGSFVKEVLVDRPGHLLPYVDKVGIDDLLQTVSSNYRLLSSAEVVLLWRLCCLYRWLEQGGKVAGDCEIAPA